MLVCIIITYVSSPFLPAFSEAHLNAFPKQILVPTNRHPGLPRSPRWLACNVRSVNFFDFQMWNFQKCSLVPDIHANEVRLCFAGRFLGAGVVATNPEVLGDWAFGDPEAT